MKLDPETTIGSLLAAIPSSAVALNKLNITIAGNKDKTLQQACTERGMQFEEFLRAMDEIDWEKETPQKDNRRTAPGGNGDFASHSRSEKS
jgi:iron-sulfur cluster repair protein YtfE (RIC family)